MVNASLNWASFYGIGLMVCGAGLYFLRSWKPGLARDYDVFFAAVGLLCGGIFIFQGWRLDPILTFGCFLLVGSTVFFGYESVRLRGVATEQARRSSYFDDEPMPGGSRPGWDDSYEQQFEDPPMPRRRRFAGSEGFEEPSQNDFYRPRRTSRAAIPEQAASRRSDRTASEQEMYGQDGPESARRMERFRRAEDERSSFGDRRNLRDDQRRGTRPSARERTERRPNNLKEQDSSSRIRGASSTPQRTSSRTSSGNGPTTNKPEDAAFSPKRTPRVSRENRDPDSNVQQTRYRASGRSSRNVDTQSDSPSARRGNRRRRDNSSRFDD